MATFASCHCEELEASGRGRWWSSMKSVSYKGQQVPVRGERCEADDGRHVRACRGTPGIGFVKLSGCRLGAEVCACDEVSGIWPEIQVVEHKR